MHWSTLGNWHWNSWALDCYYLSKYCTGADTILYSKYGTVPYNFLFTLIHMLQRTMGIQWIVISLWQYGLVRTLYGTVPQYSTLPYGTVISAVSKQQSALFLWIRNEATLTLSSIWGQKYLVLMCLVLLKNANYCICNISHLKCVIDMT